MGVVCLASDGGPSILPRLALSSCVLRSWLILIIAVKQHQCLGFCRITAQSSTEARGKIACCPSDRPDNMVQQLAGVNQHHVSCGCAIDRPSKTLDERCFTSFSQTPELVDERRKCMTQFVLEDICHLHATLLTDDQQEAEYGRNVKYGLTVHDNNLLHLLHSLHFPLDFAVECTTTQRCEILALSDADVKRILNVYFCGATCPLTMDFTLRGDRLALPSRLLSDDIHVHTSLGRYWPPLAGSQRSSDTRSCSGRCLLPGRKKAGHHRIEADRLEELMNIRKNIQMEKWDDMLLTICATMDKLGCKCGQLTGIHALSDCDIVSYPYGKGKKSSLKVLMNDDVWSRKSPSLCACSNRKARRLGLIRQSTQSFSNGCSLSASLYSRNSWHVLEEILEQYCRNEMACT